MLFNEYRLAWSFVILWSLIGCHPKFDFYQGDLHPVVSKITGETVILGSFYCSEELKISSLPCFSKIGKGRMVAIQDVKSCLTNMEVEIDSVGARSYRLPTIHELEYMALQGNQKTSEYLHEGSLEDSVSADRKIVFVATYVGEGSGVEF